MILVTGGCGYIGSHAVVDLAVQGYELIILDNLSNSSENIIYKINEITKKKIQFIQGDIRDRKLLESIFKKYNISAVFHFAGLKSVSQSIISPIEYYSNNVVGTINLLQVMQLSNVNKMVFSSSATIYSSDNPLPWSEDDKLAISTHPYGNSKVTVENILKSISSIDKNWKIAVLRYFNPIGAHESGLIGEFNIKQSSNLIPSISRVALGISDFLKIFGDDFETEDGSGIRDYIHIDDLIRGHALAFNYLDKNDGYFCWNLGTGKGFSVFEIIEEFELVSKKKIKYKIVGRRSGDLGQYWSNTKKAEKELKWFPQKNLKQMIEDTWRFINNQEKY